MYIYIRMTYKIFMHNIHVLKQIAFEFTRPEINKVIHQGVLPCRFGVLTF